MNKKFIVIIITCLIVCGSIFGYFFVESKKELDDNQTEVLSDAKKFAKEYPDVGEENVFVYRDIEEIIKIMQKGTGVVYLGFPECPWCQYYVKYLNEVAKEVGLEKIYYYNIYNDRDKNTEEYQEIVTILEKELQVDEEGNARIYVPNVSFHIDGKLIGNDFETSLDTKNLSDPADYWTNDEITDLKEKLTKYMNNVKKELEKCTDCNR